MKRRDRRQQDLQDATVPEARTYAPGDTVTFRAHWFAAGDPETGELVRDTGRMWSLPGGATGGPVWLVRTFEGLNEVKVGFPYTERVPPPAPKVGDRVRVLKDSSVYFQNGVTRAGRDFLVKVTHVENAMVCWGYGSRRKRCFVDDVEVVERA